jgi:hypothetical protein
MGDRAMPRHRYPKLLRLAQAVARVTIAVVAVSCAGSPVTASKISLSTFEQAPEQWSGAQVQVEGQLLRFTDPDGTTYGVIQDAQLDRVGLRDIQAWQALVGQQVIAEGTVRYDPSFGWYLDRPSISGVSR